MLFSSFQPAINNVSLHNQNTNNFRFSCVTNSSSSEQSQINTNNNTNNNTDIFQNINNQLNSNIKNIQKNKKNHMFKKKKGCGCGSRK